MILLPKKYYLLLYSNYRYLLAIGFLGTCSFYLTFILSYLYWYLITMNSLLPCFNLVRLLLSINYSRIFHFQHFILIIIYFIYNLTIVSIILTFFQCYILYSEQYFSLTIDMINTALQLISVWKKVPLCSLLYYLLLTAGYSITMVSIKLFITVSMMIGNIIDIYLSGIMIVLINWLMYSGYFGLILCSYLLYLFLTRMELFLIISFMLEPFSIISQSLTLSNRLSINILAGSLSISSLSVAVIIFSIYLIINSILIILLLIIYSFELINSLVQLFIFNLLSIEYLVFINYNPTFLSINIFYGIIKDLFILTYHISLSKGLLYFIIEY